MQDYPKSKTVNITALPRKQVITPAY